MTNSVTDFPARYAEACHALRVAQIHVLPLAPETEAELKAWNPEKYARMMEKIAEIEATIPALQATFDELDARACGRCNGSGEYAGASNYVKNGRKVCFRCEGSGQHS